MRLDTKHQRQVTELQVGVHQNPGVAAGVFVVRRSPGGQRNGKVHRHGGGTGTSFGGKHPDWAGPNGPTAGHNRLRWFTCGNRIKGSRRRWHVPGGDYWRARSPKLAAKATSSPARRTA